MKRNRDSPAIKSRKIGVIALAAIIFFTISGGPFGLEPIVGYAGHWAIPLLLIVPLLWDIPSILMVLELNSMMPEVGGYYQWVKRALGIRWAFYEGWWTWLYTFVDLAIYPVLFVEYASFFFPDIHAWKIPVCLVIIWGNGLLNIRGVVSIGRATLLLGAIVITPFVLLVITHFTHPGAHVPPPVNTGMPLHAFGLALFTVMWNYIGWDNATTYANEINKPARSYIFSIALAFGCIYLLYFLSVYTAQHSGVSAKDLSENGFPFVGLRIGGRWLGSLLSAGGMASMLGIFTAVLLSVSRIPAAMAEDRLLPKFLTRHHPKYGTPYVSIILCAVITSFMILFSFEELLVIDISLYASGIALEFISLIILRKKFPLEARPFKVPLSTSKLIIVSALPFVVYGTAITAVVIGSKEGLTPVYFAAFSLASAHLIWLLFVRKRINR